MTNYDKVLEEAIGNLGLINSAQAKGKLDFIWGHKYGRQIFLL